MRSLKVGREETSTLDLLQIAFLVFGVCFPLLVLLIVKYKPEILYKPREPTDEARIAELDARLKRKVVVRELLNAGNKIQAIKVYREDTGASLKEAKDAVESMQREMRQP